MSKQPPKGPEYSREREFKVILEDVQSRFRAFGEGQEDLRNRLERVEQKVDTIEEDTGQLKVQMSFVFKALPTVATKDDLKRLEKRLTTIEASR